MQAFAIGSSADDPGFQGEEAQPVLELEGVEGSSLRATLSGVVIRSCPTGSAGTKRRWSDDQLGPVRIDAYGPIGSSGPRFSRPAMSCRCSSWSRTRSRRLDAASR
jgi:hypothetical protein